MRAQCSGILLAFLLDYPLSTTRLQHHLNFLVANASFQHESGREAALDALLVSASAARSFLTLSSAETLALACGMEAAVSQRRRMIFLSMSVASLRQCPCLRFASVDILSSTLHGHVETPQFLAAARLLKGYDGSLSCLLLIQW